MLCWTRYMLCHTAKCCKPHLAYDLKVKKKQSDAEMWQLTYLKWQFTIVLNQRSRTFSVPGMMGAFLLHKHLHSNEQNVLYMLVDVALNEIGWKNEHEHEVQICRVYQHVLWRGRGERNQCTKGAKERLKLCWKQDTMKGKAWIGRQCLEMEGERWWRYKKLKTKNDEECV